MILTGPLALNPALRTNVNLPAAGMAVSTNRPVGPAGWSRWGIDRGKYRFWIAPQDAAVEAVQKLYKQKIGSSLKEKFGNVCERAKRAGFEDILHPIGVASLLGVDVAAGKLNAAVQEASGFSIAYKPNPWQQWQADLTIYYASQRKFLGAMGFMHSDNRETWGKLMGLLVSPIPEVTGTARSVNTAKGGYYTTFIPGYGLNPIQPTEEELTGPGGMNSYWARGGFLLDKSLVTGAWMRSAETNKTGAWKLYINNGYGLCDGKVITTVTGFPENRAWNVGLKIDAAGTYYMTVKLAGDDWQAFKDTLRGAAQEIEGFLCRNQDVLRGLGTSTMNDPSVPAEARAMAAGGLIVLNENCPAGSAASSAASGGGGGKANLDNKGGGGGGKANLDNKDTAERSWWSTLPDWQQGALIAGGAVAALAVVRKTQRT